MTLDVAFSPLELTPADVAGRTVVVIDVLRATTTICTALAAGAREVVVTAGVDEAIRLAQTLDPASTLLAGERNAIRIAGFQLGNSPGEMTPDVVRDRTLVMTTTNGTAALLAAAGAREVIVAAAVNLNAASERARAAFAADRNVMIICAGREHGFGLDDAYVAGRIAVAILGGRRHRKGLNDAALVAVDLVIRYGDRVERVLGLSRAGRELTALGFRADIEAAARVDACPVVPIYHDRRVALLNTVERAA
jgi:2-phosphosulfolactate phosphatase